MKTSLAPAQIDTHVGARIRIRRRDLGVSQSALAEALGLTFQQVQKYERGANRVSASKLYEIAAVLRAPVAWFFEGLPHDDAAPDEADASATDRLLTRFSLTPGARDLMAVWPDVPGAIRGQLAALAREIAASADSGGDERGDDEGGDDEDPALAMLQTAAARAPARLDA